jgi:hypothetical protein
MLMMKINYRNKVDLLSGINSEKGLFNPF